MGGLLAIILAAGLPPTDDGAGCEAWAANRAHELAIAAQPSAAALGSDGPGLADVDLRTWTAFVPEVPQSTSESRDRFAAALDGRAAICTASELVQAAQRVEPQLRTLLTAARGARNTLPASFQLWAVLDSNPSPNSVDLNAAIRLGVARGRDALNSHQFARAIETCVGLLGLVRASAGTSLVGRLVAGAWGTRTRAFCLDTAALVTPAQREELRAALTHLSDGWPDFAHTLGQELVFAQVSLFSRYWSEETRSRRPADAIHLSQAAEKQDHTSSWQRVRRALFGQWSAREQCLLYARALPLVDAPPSIADPALRTLGVAPLLWRLADFPLPDRDDSWVRVFRRVRALETELAFLRAGLAAWEFRDRRGAWPASLESLARDPWARLDEKAWKFIDARTGQRIVLELKGGSVFLVARADPSVDAEEIRALLLDPR